ncbi:MAG: hypothetical protein ACOYLK_11580 [Sphingomonas sp.]
MDGSNLLGTGKWQVNPAAGLVYMWSQRSFTAVIYEHSFSFAGDAARPDISVNQLRALHSFILDRGFCITFDGKHEWQTLGRNENGTTTEFEVGRQFSARWATSLRIGKAYGDCRNDGTLEFNVRTFF